MNREALLQILFERSLLIRLPHEEPFVLSSGKTSRHYLDIDRTTSYGPALPMIGEAVYNCLPADIVAIGGPTRGADPIATAAAYYSTNQWTIPLSTFSILKTTKPHGIAAFIEGSVGPGDMVAVVDDVLTTGKSVITAVQECWDHDLRVGSVIILVDREEGGFQQLQDYLGSGLVQVLYRYSELVGRQ